MNTDSNTPDRAPNSNEIILTGMILGAWLAAPGSDAYEAICIGYPTPGATNQLLITNKTTRKRYMVDISEVPYFNVYNKQPKVKRR